MPTILRVDGFRLYFFSSDWREPPHVHIDRGSRSAKVWLDGRTISVPLAWYPRLFDRTPEQRAKWEICGAGYGIHWPDLDEDLSTEGLLRGEPAPQRATQASTTQSSH